MRAVLSCLVAVPLLAGCDNVCQTLCVNLAEYAETCGTPYTEGELDACIETWSDPSGEELATCREYGTPDIVRREWTCDDVNLYQDLPEG